MPSCAWYADSGRVVLPFIDDTGSLMGYVRDQSGNLNQFPINGKVPIPDTDVILKPPKLRDYESLPNSGSIRKLTREHIANTIVPAVSKELDDYFRKYLNMDEYGYAVLTNYVISSWMPDCYSVIPHLLLTCPNSPGLAQLCRDVVGAVTPRVTAGKLPDLQAGAAWGLTLVGDVSIAEKGEKMILMSGNRRGIVQGYRSNKGQSFGPRILTRTQYFRYDFCYEVIVKSGSGDDYYSDLFVSRRQKDFRQSLAAIRLKHGIEVLSGAQGDFSRLDVLGSFKSSGRNKIEKFKFILVPALLYNSDLLTPLRKFMTLEVRCDDDIDLVVLSEIQKILDTCGSDIGWYICRKDIFPAVKAALGRMGWSYDSDVDMDKMLGAVMFGMRLVPAKRSQDGWVHWCNRAAVKEEIERIQKSRQKVD